MRKYFFAFSILLLSSCSSILPQATLKDTLILGAEQEQFCESRDQGSAKIEEFGSPDFFRTQKILFRDNAQLGSYQLAQWSEPVTDRIVRVLSESLRCDGFKIASAGEGADVEFKISILDFTHEASSPPGKFRGVFRVKKSKDDASEEKLFSFERPVNSYDVEGARVGADGVLMQLVSAMKDWS